MLYLLIYEHSFRIKHSGLNVNDRQRKIANRLMDDFEGVLITIKWAKSGKCSQDTALGDTQVLIGKGILEESRQGGRSTNYELKPHEL